MARKPTLEAINQQIAKLQQQAAALVDDEKAEVISKIKVAVVHYGITAEDLDLVPRASRKTRKSNGTTKPQRQSTAGKIKYKDAAGNTWSGVGRRPRWYLDALASGTSEADLRA